MNKKTIAENEYQYATVERQLLINILKCATKFKVYIATKDGQSVDLDFFHNFPFCIDTEIKNICSDAIIQYDNYISELLNLKNEKE